MIESDDTQQPLNRLYLDFDHAREDDSKKHGWLGKGLATRLSLLKKQHGQYLFKNWPGNASSEDLLDYVVRNYFPEKLPLQFFLSNLSLSESYWRLMFRLPVGPRLQDDMPSGLTIAFIGEVQDKHSDQPSLTIRDVKIVAATELLSFEREIQCEVALNQPAWEAKKGNVISKSWLQELPPISKQTKRQLEEWRGYIDFKKQVVKHQELGVRYLTCLPNGEKQQIQFVVCFEQGDNVLNRLKRQQLSCFDLAVSEGEWKFSPPIEQPRNKRINDIRLGDIKDKDLRRLGKSESAPLIHLLAETGFNNPQFFTMTFDLCDNDKEALDKQLLDAAEAQEWIEDKFPPQGFLAISTAGDKAQINCHKRALDQLERQSGYNPMLSVFLFNIQEARVPESIALLDQNTIFNQDLNEYQKACVEKMMSAPDICMVQGPPGTGKTTVIAEAIYQLVRKGERILLVSQAHLAVDNALERLPMDPSIRALRLGRENKISIGGKQFTKPQVLKRFYQGIGEQLHNESLGVWKTLEQRQERSRYYIDKLSGLQEDLLRDQKRIVILEDSRSQKQHQLQTAQQKLEHEIVVYREQQTEQQQANSSLKALRSELWSKCYILDIISSDWQQQTCNLAAILRRQGLVMNLPLPKVSDVLSVRLDFCRAWLQHSADALTHYNHLTDDLNRLKSGEILENTATALEITRLKIEQDRLMNLMQAGDDSVISSWREIGAQVSELESQKGGLDRSVYQGLVVEGSELLQPSCSLEDAKQELESLVIAMSLLQQQRPLLVAQLEEQLDGYRQKILTEPDQKPLQQAKIALNKIQHELNQWQDRANDVQKKLGSCLHQANEEDKLPVDLKNVQISLEKLQQEEIECQQRLNDGGFRQQWQPLLERWHNNLIANDLNADNEHYLNDFIPQCNVIAITCNEKDRTLDDIGAESFDTVIIDEVSKATPPELLAPIMRARRVILVGDHRQLPPVFQERHDESWEEAVAKAEESGDEPLLTQRNLKKYEKMVTASLFKQHFEEADDSLKSSLFTQYRMHPQIMDLINVFYENRLKCGLFDPDNERAHGLTIPSAQHESIPFIRPDSHAYWINSSRMPDGKPFYEQQAGTSKVNPLEVQLIVQALQKLNLAQPRAKDYFQKELSRVSELADRESNSEQQEELRKTRDKIKVKLDEADQKKRVGIISFYGRQVSDLRKAIKPLRSKLQHLEIDINTVDQFQGKEEDIIMVSMVRNTLSGRSGSSAYVAQFERINVALSRARQLLMIFGAREMFSDYEVKLPNLDRPGERKRRVYADIIEQLARNNSIYESDALLHIERDKGVLINLQKTLEQQNSQGRQHRKKHGQRKGHNQRHSSSKKPIRS